MRPEQPFYAQLLLSKVAALTCCWAPVDFLSLSFELLSVESKSDFWRCKWLDSVENPILKVRLCERFMVFVPTKSPTCFSLLLIFWRPKVFHFIITLKLYKRGIGANAPIPLLNKTSHLPILSRFRRRSWSSHSCFCLWDKLLVVWLKIYNLLSAVCDYEAGMADTI